MKKVLFVGFMAILGLSGAASAADLRGGYKDIVPQYAMGGPNWTGFYLGAGFGGGIANHHITADEGIEIDGAAKGILGTVQAGYDRVIAPRILAGVFADVDFTDLSTSVDLTAAAEGLAGHAHVKTMWSAGGRLGYLVNSSTLLYVLGAYTEAEFTTDIADASNATFSGYSVGGGMEAALTGNWFLKGEYRYTGLNKASVEATYGVADELSIQSGRVSLVFKFAPGLEPLK